MAAGDLAITCDNKALVDIMTLVASCFGKKSNGQIYLRVELYSQQAGEADAVTCSTNTLTPEQLVEQLMRMSIVKNSEGKNVLRLGEL